MVRFGLLGVVVMAALLNVDALKCVRCATPRHGSTIPLCSGAGIKECEAGDDVCMDFKGTWNNHELIQKDCGKRADIGGSADCNDDYDKNGMKGKMCGCATDTCNSHLIEGSSPGGSAPGGNPNDGSGSGSPPAGPPPPPTPPTPPPPPTPPAPPAPPTTTEEPQGGGGAPTTTEAENPGTSTDVAGEPAGDGEPDGAFGSKPNFFAMCILVPLSAVLSRFAML